MIILLKGELIKKISLHKMSGFPDLYTSSKNKSKVELDLSNYATKSNLKNGTGADTSKFAKETDLASLKWNSDKLDIDKFQTVPVDLYKLSNVAEKNVVEKDVYDELVK